eukprot:2887433-Prymnesium_polylepis.1
MCATRRPGQPPVSPLAASVRIFVAIMMPSPWHSGAGGSEPPTVRPASPLQWIATSSLHC